MAVNVADLTARLTADTASYIGGIQAAIQANQQLSDSGTKLGSATAAVVADTQRASEQFRAAGADAKAHAAGLDQASGAAQGASRWYAALGDALSSARGWLASMTASVGNAVENLGGLTDKTTVAGQAFGGLDDTVGRLSGGVLNLGRIVELATNPITIIGAVITGTSFAVYELGQHMVNTAEHIRSLQAVAGGSAEQVEAFAGAFKLAGLDSDRMSTAMVRLGQQVETGGQGFAKLHISLEDLAAAGDDELKIFELVRGKMGELGTQSERNAAGMAIFGRAFREISPVFQMTTEQFSAYIERAGAVSGWTDQMQEASLRYLQAQKLVEADIEGVMNRLGAAVLPMLTNITERFGNWFADVITGSNSAGIALAEVTTTITAALANLKDALTPTSEATKYFGEKLYDLWGTISLLWDLIRLGTQTILVPLIGAWTTLSALLSGDVTGALGKGKAAMADMLGEMQKSADMLNEDMERYTEWGSAAANAAAQAKEAGAAARAAEEAGILDLDDARGKSLGAAATAEGMKKSLAEAEVLRLQMITARLVAEQTIQTAETKAAVATRSTTESAAIEQRLAQLDRLEAQYKREQSAEMALAELTRDVAGKTVSAVEDKYLKLFAGLAAQRIADTAALQVELNKQLVMHDTIAQAIEGLSAKSADIRLKIETDYLKTLATVDNSDAVARTAVVGAIEIGAAETRRDRIVALAQEQNNRTIDLFRAGAISAEDMQKRVLKTAGEVATAEQAIDQARAQSTDTMYKLQAAAAEKAAADAKKFRDEALVASLQLNQSDYAAFKMKLDNELLAQIDALNKAGVTDRQRDDTTRALRDKQRIELEDFIQKEVDKNADETEKLRREYDRRLTAYRTMLADGMINTTVYGALVLSAEADYQGKITEAARKEFDKRVNAQRATLPQLQAFYSDAQAATDAATAANIKSYQSETDARLKNLDVIRDADAVSGRAHAATIANQKAIDGDYFGYVLAQTTKIGADLPTTWTEIGKDMTDAAKGSESAFASFFLDLEKGTTNSKKLFDDMLTAMEKAVADFLAAGTIKTLLSFFFGATPGVSGAVSGGAAAAGGAVANAIGISSTAGLVGGALKDVADWLKAWGSSASGMGAALEGMEGVAGAGSTLTAADATQIASITTFAAGGVPGSLGAPQLVLAHGGEMILNEGQQSRLADLLGVPKYQEGGVVGGPTDVQVVTTDVKAGIGAAGAATRGAGWLFGTLGEAGAASTAAAMSQYLSAVGSAVGIAMDIMSNQPDVVKAMDAAFDAIAAGFAMTGPYGWAAAIAAQLAKQGASRTYPYLASGDWSKVLESAAFAPVYDVAGLFGINMMGPSKEWISFPKRAIETAQHGLDASNLLAGALVGSTTPAGAAAAIAAYNAVIAKDIGDWFSRPDVAQSPYGIGALPDVAGDIHGAKVKQPVWMSKLQSPLQLLSADVLNKWVRNLYLADFGRYPEEWERAQQVSNMLAGRETAARIQAWADAQGSPTTFGVAGPAGGFYGEYLQSLRAEGWTPEAVGVKAHAMGLPGYASGIDYVPRTGLALVHEGERITPASENASPTPSGGSGPLIINVTLDGRVIGQAVLDDFTRRDLSGRPGIYDSFVIPRNRG